MQLEKTMFREYDIRGRVSDSELNENSVEIIARGFGTMLKKRNVNDCVVGYDARSYSEPFKNALVKGLTASGVNVIDLGMITTPMCYFAQVHFKVKGCAMITASHNPNGWSGFKFGYDFAKTLLPDDIKELQKIIEKEEFVEADEDKKGKIRKENIAPHYEKDHSQRTEHNKERRLKVVVNCRNGIAGKYTSKMLRNAGFEVVEQFCNVDFSYPNGNPNPSLDEMLQELGEKVREENADLGFAFDGDGDRLGMVDEKGNAIYPDRILIMLSRLVLKKNPNAKIVFDVKSTQALDDDIRQHGGEPVMWITGHSYIKQKAHEIEAALAGERSGHIFFIDGYHGFDDAIFASMKILEYISHETKKVSEIVETFPKYYSSPVLHAPCRDEVKYEIVEKATEYFKQKFGKEKVIDINGARVVFDDGWGLVRASSNLPVIVLGFEAKSEERLSEIEDLFREELKKFPEISQEWVNG